MFLTTISASKKMFSFRVRAEKGIARYIDASGVVFWLAPSEHAHGSYPGLFFRPPGFSPYMGREERRVQGLDYSGRGEPYFAHCLATRAGKWKVRLTRLDSGLFLFLRVYAPGLWTRKKRNVANVQPSWPHAWSMPHRCVLVSLDIIVSWPPLTVYLVGESSATLWAVGSALVSDSSSTGSSLCQSHRVLFLGKNVLSQCLLFTQVYKSFHPAAKHE